MEARYETWENLAEDVEITTAQSDVWACFLADDAA